MCNREVVAVAGLHPFPLWLPPVVRASLLAFMFVLIGVLILAMDWRNRRGRGPRAMTPWDRREVIFIRLGAGLFIAAGIASGLLPVLVD